MTVEYATLALVGVPGLAETLAIVQGHACRRAVVTVDPNNGMIATVLVLVSPGAGETPEQAASDEQMVSLAFAFLRGLSHTQMVALAASLEHIAADAVRARNGGP